MIKFLLVIHNQLLFGKLRNIWSAGYNNHHTNTKRPGKQDTEYA